MDSIGKGIFADFYELERVSIPASVCSIVPNLFQGCSRLSSIDTFSNNQNFVSENGALFGIDMTTLISCQKSNGDYEVPQGVVTIGDYAFSKRTELTSITFLSTLKESGESVFEDSRLQGKLE